MRNLETKREIRTRIKKERAELPTEVRQAWSDKIFSAVVEHPLYMQAEEIYCYVSFGEEVATNALVEYSRKMGKKVAVPKILVDNSPKKLESEGRTGTFHEMEFYYIDSMDELAEGYYGILEPPKVRKASGKHVLVIMPGVAFDRHGGRIGYGKGFYDTYLKKHPGYRRVALAYEMQCLDMVPSEEHDIRPEIIITEKEIYTC